MLKSAFEKLVRQTPSYESHDLIRLQSKIARLTKNLTEKTLAEFKLSPLQWSIIGIAKTHPQGVRYVTISQRMGVEAPFVTEVVDTLKKKGVLKISTDPEDKRAKVVTLSARGEGLVSEIEKKVKGKIDNTFSDLSSSDIKTYLSTIRKMIEKIEAKV